MISTSVEQRHKFLIDSSVNHLNQALDLLDRMSDREYVLSPASLASQRIGGHIRHVVEFYECLLDGLRRSQIDYDARKRDAGLEVDRPAAIIRIRKLIARLSGPESPMKDSVLFVRVEDSEGSGLDHDYMVSSIGRELQALASHTVHHFGLISLIARLIGIAVDEGFGFAPSTLRYRAALRSEAA